MERRTFIGGAGLAGILAAGVAPAAHANQAIRWRLASSFPKTLDIAHSGINLFARTVKAMSGGRIDIAVYPADELMPAFGVLDGVQHGTVECGHTVSNYYVGRDAAFAFDASIPFGLNARQTNAWMRHGDGQSLLREFFREHGVVNFPLGNTGAQMGGWYRRPPRAPADLKGLKMRIAGLGGQIMNRLGASARGLPGGDIYAALERGVIDAAEWIGPHDDLKLGLHKIAKYYAYPGWWEGANQFSLYINQRAHDALSNESKAIVETAAAAAHLDIQAQYDAKNPRALKELIATGARLTPLPRSILDAAHRTARELYAELADQNPHWRKIHANYAAFLKDQTWHWGHAEMSFDRYMNDKRRQDDEQAKRAKSAPAGRRSHPVKAGGAAGG